MLEFGRRRGGAEAQFRVLFDAAPDPLALLDAEGRIRAANPALALLVGPALPLRPGLAAGSLIAAAARPALAERIAAAHARAPEPPPLRVAPVAPCEPDAEWELGCRALAERPRDDPMLLLRVTDRTEAKRAETRLREASRLETVGRLAGGIAHDFNNLLTAILGAAEAAAIAPSRDGAAAELRQIEDAARRGAGLVGQLLAFARQQVLRPAVVDLNAAIAAIVPLLRRLVGHTVDIELALEHPGRRVLVDPTQLDQVLMNLAANAREAMPTGGTLRIATGHAVVLEAGGVPPGRYAVLEVSDTGRGMPPEVRARIFEPFYTTRPDRGGTGLGLATVQGIVAQHGGHISVESEVGRGATFRLLLPRHDGAAAEAPPPRAPTAAAVAAPILLVEDEAPLRRLAQLVLERAGHTVRIAPDAEAALALAEDDAAQPAALVSDVAMPGLDGVSLAQRLRARWPGLPVLLTSGYAPAACAADFAGERMEFLPKPYAPAQLREAVAALLGGGG